MAYRKMCDNCGAELGMDNNPFMNVWGSISDQVESLDGNEIKYRYLTPRPQTKLALCGTDCLTGWIGTQRANTEYADR